MDAGELVVPGAMPLERIEAEITELAGHLAAAECRWLQLVAEFDDRRGFEQWGSRDVRAGVFRSSRDRGVRISCSTTVSKGAGERLDLDHVLTSLWSVAHRSG